MTAEAVGRALATVNAGLNLTSAILLLAGLRFILRRDIARHRLCMLGAVASGALFLVFYATRFSLTGTHSFGGPDAMRPWYLAILFSHMVLAIVVVPLVLRLLFLASRERFEAHRRLARWTFPVWLYVSVTGLAVYLMLYHAGGGVDWQPVDSRQGPNFATHLHTPSPRFSHWRLITLIPGSTPFSSARWQ